MKDVLQQICDVLKGELGRTDSSVSRFVLRDNGSGLLDNSGEVGARVTWENLDDCVKQLRTRSLQAATDRVVAAVKAHFGRQGCSVDGVNEMMAANAALQALGAGHGQS